METVLERAQKIADCIGGKVWSNASETRVYLKAKSCGYYVVGTQGVNPKNTKNASSEFMAIRDAGLLDYSELQKTGVASTPMRRTSCLNCGITNTILMGRGYCTDCHGECN